MNLGIDFTLCISEASTPPSAVAAILPHARLPTLGGLRYDLFC